MPTVSHRRARSADVAGIQDVECDAGRRFIDIGMPEIADDPPLATELLTELVRNEHVGSASRRRSSGRLPHRDRG